MDNSGRFGGKPLDLAQMLAEAVRTGALPQAERAYRQVVNAKPDHVEALHLLGVLRFQQGHHEEALNLIAAALKVAPRYPEALFNRGNILAQLERYDEAIASYDQVLATIPNYPEAHHNRGNSLFARLRFEEALATYDNAIAGRRDYVEALDSRGNTLWHLNGAQDSVSFGELVAMNVMPGSFLTEEESYYLRYALYFFK
jgi:tetratricopeptide (TPR) repeat protein